MLGFSFPPFELGILACFGLVPLLAVLDEVEGVKGSLRWVYLSMMIFHIVVINWTGGYEHMNDKYMMIAGGITMLWHPLFYFIPMLAYMYVRKYIGPREALVSLPFLWVAYEYSHSLSEWSFPWLTIGNSQSYNLARIQFISATSVFGLSFWIVTMNILAFFLYKQVSVGVWKLFSKESAVLASVIALVYVAPSIYGYKVLSHAPANGIEEGQPTITIGMVQSNIDPWEKWKNQNARHLEYYLSRTESLSAGKPRPDLVLWPETAVTYYFLTEQGAGVLQQLRERVSAMNTPVLTGLQHAIFYEDSTTAPPSSKRSKVTGQRFDVFNAAALVEPNSSEVQWYGKTKMVPIAERVPYADAFHFLDFLRWDVGIGGWQLGPEPTIFQEEKTGARFSAMICYESTYPEFVASFVKRGAEFIAIITIDSWWGRMSGAFQHHQFAIFRAIETRRWIARCAVGGMSSFIDPYGRVYGKTELFTEALPLHTIGRSRELTLFARLGDWFSQICAIISIILVATAVGEQFMNKEPDEHANNH